MEDFLEIIKFTIPGLLVLAATIFLIKKYLESNQRDKMFELKSAAQKEVFPRRLQAYERLVLFLERISPNSLVMRIHKSGMSAKLLQAELANAIRDEYEHNIAQQVYISADGWNKIKNAKEEMIQLINISATKVNEDSTGVELAQKIFEVSAALGTLPTDTTIASLKKEIQKYF